MAINSTRLRYISASTAEEVSRVVDALPFKVEIKQIVGNTDLWHVWFVIPDNAPEFQNLEM